MKASTRKVVGFWLLFSLPLLWTVVFLLMPYGAMGMSRSACRRASAR